MEISRADAVKLAQQSKTALLQRLHDGGENMPPFPHLNEAEVASLFAYLKQLAGMPGRGVEQLAVKESPIRIGEHIVKSTCHTCHGAAGPNPTPQQLGDGAIPPLSTLTTRKSRPEFVRKVTQGAPILMGTPPTLYRGRMPVFYYLSQHEAADVYLYLTLYPPSELASCLHDNRAVSNGSRERRRHASSAGSLSSRRCRQQPAENSALQARDRRTCRPSLCWLSLAALVILLLAGGLGFTMHEFKRLAAEKPTDRSSLAVKTKYPSRGGTRMSLATFSNGVFSKLRFVQALQLPACCSHCRATSHAIPAFARMYGTSCSTCHIDFPKLNDFGKAFKDAGFKFPKDDESMLKIPPVMLGAPANKELWPKAIWPGTIPGIPPIGLQMNNYFQYTGTSSGKFASLTPAGTLPPFVPRTDFETGLFSLFHRRQLRQRHCVLG